MATPAATIAIPSDVHPFAANMSPRGVDLEGRLDLSLDALIKVRRNEHKLLKKQEEANKKKSAPSADKRKTPKQQKTQQLKQMPTLKNGQKVQRKALVSKNRGLPMLPAAAKGKAAHVKTKTSIAVTTAKLRRQMRADKAKNILSGRLVVSPRALKGTNQNNAAQQSKKKSAPQQARKVTSSARMAQSKTGKNMQVLKQQPKAQAQTPVRQVKRSNNKKVKLSITITGPTSKKNSQKKHQQTTKVLLPGKLSQALAKKTYAAKKVVKHAKNRKTTAAKTTQIVRNVPGRWKKN